MAVPLIRQLASRIVELQAEPLSDALIAKAKQCIIDFLAAAFAGTDSGSFRAVAGATAAWGGGNCTLIGLPSTGTAVRAALHNGICLLYTSHSGGSVYRRSKTKRSRIIVVRRHSYEIGFRHRRNLT